MERHFGKCRKILTKVDEVGWGKVGLQKTFSDKECSVPSTLPHRHMAKKHGYGFMQQMEYSITDWIRGKIREERGRKRRSRRVMCCHRMKRGRCFSDTSWETTCKVNKYEVFSNSSSLWPVTFPSVISMCDFLTGSIIYRNILQLCDVKTGSLLMSILKETWRKSKHYLLILSELVGWCGGLTCSSWQHNVYYWIKYCTSNINI